MYRILLAVLLFISPLSFSQDTMSKAIREDTSATKKALDNAQHFLDSMKTAEQYKDVEQGLDNLARYHKEQQAKQRRQAMLYIGLGIFFIFVLIIGLRRRVKE